MRELLEALVAQEQAADHQKRRDRARHERADRECCGDQDRLVDERAFCNRPDDRQFPVGADAADLLRVEREIVAEDAGGFFRRSFGKQRDVVQHAGDVVDQREEAGGGHGFTVGVGGYTSDTDRRVTCGSDPCRARSTCGW